MNVVQYIIPVKQYFRCFSYGHVTGSPWNKDGLCRNLGGKFHEGDFENYRKCIHCYGPRGQYFKNLYLIWTSKKQKLERVYREDYNTVYLFPITYKRQRKSDFRSQLYSEVLKSQIDQYSLLVNNSFINIPYSKISTGHQIQLSNKHAVLADVPQRSQVSIPTQNVWFRNPNNRKTSNPRYNYNEQTKNVTVNPHSYIVPNTNQPSKNKPPDKQYKTNTTVGLSKNPSNTSLSGNINATKHI